MKAAWDRGINTFDTANIYSNGASEEVIAKFVEKVRLLLNRPYSLLNTPLTM
jgi:aryl-alcohol dehydrogenase-like predicted oxidoreductase